MEAADWRVVLAQGRFDGVLVTTTTTTTVALVHWRFHGVFVTMTDRALCQHGGFSMMRRRVSPKPIVGATIVGGHHCFQQEAPLSCCTSESIQCSKTTGAPTASFGDNNWCPFQKFCLFVRSAHLHSDGFLLYASLELMLIVHIHEPRTCSLSGWSSFLDGSRPY